MFDSGKQYTQNELPSDVFNAGSGAGGNIVNYNGHAVQVYNNGNGTRKLVDLGDYNSYQATNKAQSDYKAATDTAISGLEQKKTDLAGQYGDLLKTVTGEYQPLVDQTTATAGAELSRRGLTPDSTLFQQQTQGALAPVYGSEAANAQQIGAGSIADTNTLANNIAQLQTGVAGTASQLPLQYGSLALSTQALPSQIALAQAQTNQANTGANYISIPGVGVYDLTSKSLLGGLSNNNLSSGGYSILNVGAGK